MNGQITRSALAPARKASVSSVPHPASTSRPSRGRLPSLSRSQRLVQQGFEEALAGGGGGGKAGLQQIAEGHQLIYLGDDSMLLGEGRNANRLLFIVAHREVAMS